MKKEFIQIEHKDLTNIIFIMSNITQVETSGQQNGWTVVKKVKPRKIKAVRKESKQQISQKITLKSTKEIPVKGPARFKKKSEETDIVVPKTITIELAKKIQQARNNKVLSRKELAIKLNVIESKITDIENGTALYDGQLCSRIKKLLEIK